MKAKDLTKLWARPDNSRLAPKQVSVRLPTHVLARIRALEEMYPTRTRTEIISDLLHTALDEVQKGLPNDLGHPMGLDPDTNQEIFEETGPIDRFRTLSNKYFREIEAELGNHEPEPFFSGTYVITEHDLKE